MDSRNPGSHPRPGSMKPRRTLSEVQNVYRISRGYVCRSVLSLYINQLDMKLIAFPFFLFQRHGPSQYGIEAFNSSRIGLVIISKEKPVVTCFLSVYI